MKDDISKVRRISGLTKCEVCGYEGAVYDINLTTLETHLMCVRCGFIRCLELNKSLSINFRYYSFFERGTAVDQGIHDETDASEEQPVAVEMEKAEEKSTLTLSERVRIAAKRYSKDQLE